MTIKELRDKRNKLMADAQAILQKPEVKAEDRTAFDAMITEVDVIESDIARLEKVEKYEAEQRKAVTPPRPNPGAGNQESLEQRKAAEKRAFADFVLTGTKPQGEARDLTTGSTGAGYFVPQAFYPQLIEAQKLWGEIMNMVKTIESDNGAPTKYALVDDTANLFYEVDEDTAAATDGSMGSDPTITGGLLSTSVLTRQPIIVSLAEMQDSAFDIDAFVKNVIGKSYFRGVSALIVNGSTSGNIASVLNVNSAAVYTTQPGASDTDQTEIQYPDLAALYGALDPAYEPNAEWAMNSTTRAYLLGVRDTLGRPLYVPSPSADVFDMLLGRPVKLVQALPNRAAGATPILYGDFEQGYLFKTVRPGLGVMRLNERYADKLAVGFVPFARCGGVVTDAGTHPIHALKIKASGS
jgi:HK97 family phage major capsid protein